MEKLLYVTTKDRYFGNEQDQTMPMGFLHIYKKPDDKKHDVQRNWAYSNGGCMQLYEKDGLWYKKGTVGDWDNWKPGTKVGTKNIDEPVKPQPQIWKNEPLSGFKIMKSVSRSSTSNKLWVILDPRMVQFEITTSCLEDILLAGAVINGEIQGKCVWAANKKLVLVP